MSFLATVGDRMEAEESVEVVHHVGLLQRRWSHEPGMAVPGKLLGRVDPASWAQLLGEMRPIGREMFYLRWGEALLAAAAVGLLALFIVRRDLALAAALFCSLLAAAVLANLVVVRHVRRRADRFSDARRGRLSAMGVGISAHMERSELVCSRAELWFELELTQPRRMSQVDERAGV